MLVRLEPVASCSRAKHSTTEPLRYLSVWMRQALMLPITLELLDLSYVYTLWEQLFKYTNIYDHDFAL